MIKEKEFDKELMGVKEDTVENKKSSNDKTDILGMLSTGVAVEKVIDAIKADPKCICDLPTQPEWVAEVAASVDPDALFYIANPTKKVAMVAVKSFGHAIGYIKDPGHSLKMAAIEHDPCAVKYIDNLTEDEMLYAITLDPGVLRFIDSPCNEACVLAICKDPSTLRYVNNPQDPSLCVLAYSIDKSSLKYIHTCSGEIRDKLTAIAVSDEDKQIIDEYFYVLGNVGSMFKGKITDDTAVPNAKVEWRCECGALHGKIRAGEACTICNTRVTKREVRNEQ